MADYTNRDEYDAAMQDWLREQAQDREQSNEIERVRAKAQFDAETFEKRYTLEQTNKIAQYNTYLQWVNTNDDFSPEDKKRAKEKIELLKLGIQPTDLPRLSRFPKGRGPGDYFEEGGIGWKIDKDGQRMEVDERGSIRGEDRRATHSLHTQELDHVHADAAAQKLASGKLDEERYKYIANLMDKPHETSGFEMAKNAAGVMVRTPVWKVYQYEEAVARANKIYGPPLATRQDQRIVPGVPGAPQQGQRQRGDLRSRAGQVSPGGKYVWDGTQWVPNQKR
jgi:hypothetical protein